MVERTCGSARAGAGGSGVNELKVNNFRLLSHFVIFSSIEGELIYFFLCFSFSLICRGDYYIQVAPVSYLQTDATTPNIVRPRMLGVVVSVLAVVCKRIQVHYGKDKTCAWPQQ